MKETIIAAKSSMADVRFEKPIVKIQQHCWSKMYGWCKAATTEVSGMGIAKIVDGGVEVVDVFLPKQYCSSGWTELDEESLGALQMKINPRLMKGIEYFRFWWHTHYNFKTFWSGQDEAMARLWSGRAPEWFLSLVINQKDEYRCRLDFTTPVSMTIDDIEVKVIPNPVKRKRKRNFKQDIKKWIHPIPQKVQIKGNAGTKFVWTKDNVNKIMESVKGSDYEGQIKEWLEKHRPKKKWYDRGNYGHKQEEPKRMSLLPITSLACECDHFGDYMLCICKPHCQECTKIQQEFAHGKTTVQKSIWPS